jgi:ArsR family transcriptional regulator
LQEILRSLKAVADPNRIRILRVLYSIRSSGQEAFAPRLLTLLEDVLEGREDPDRFAVEKVLARRRRATSEFFRRTAPIWDTLREGAMGGPLPVDRLVDRIEGGGTVVDLGTGTGVLLQSLGPDVHRVIGIDASPEMLEIARSRTNDVANAELRLGTFEHLPLSDGEANTMVANMVLHHVADPPGVFREIRRGLAPGGRLLIADLEEHDEESFWKALGARWPGFRPEDVREWLEAAGFEVIECEELPLDGSARGMARPPAFLMEARRCD